MRRSSLPVSGSMTAYFRVAPIPGSSLSRQGAEELGGGAFGLRGPRGAGEHRSSSAVQDLLARILADPRARLLPDLRAGRRLPRPVAAELGAVGAAHDALGAVQGHRRLDRARAER